MASHIYPDNGTYAVQLVVTDSHGAAGTARTTVTVSNASPVVTKLQTPVLSPTGAPVTIDVDFSDPGAADTLTATADWGDGHVESIQRGLSSHTFNAKGRYFVTITVRDDDGAETSYRAMNPIKIYEVIATFADYDVIDLGTLGGTETIPMALNDNGDVVGCSKTPNDEWHAFVWRNGSLEDLSPGHGTSCAHTITSNGLIGGVQNEAITVWNHGSQVYQGSLCCEGQISVVALTPEGEPVAHREDWGHTYESAIWSGGGKQSLGGLMNSSAFAVAMNNRGQIVGYSKVGDDRGTPIDHAFVWEKGALRDLGLLADPPCYNGNPQKKCGAAVALDINSNGQIVGTSSGSVSGRSGVMWLNGTIRELGFDYPLVINDAGDVAGYNHGPGYARAGDAFFWHQGTLMNLGSLGGGAVVVDMNAASTVVGWSMTVDTMPTCLSGRPATRASETSEWDRPIWVKSVPNYRDQCTR